MRRRRAPGRPRQVVIARFLQHIVGCVPEDTAARAVGLEPAAVRAAFARGRKAKPGHPDRVFLERYEQAQAIAEARLLGAIGRAARTDWHAAAFLLRAESRSESR